MRPGDGRSHALVALGLPRYPASVYVALHDLGVGRPREVAEASGVPLARAYEALEDLVRLRLAEVVEGAPKRYRALSVDALVDREIAEIDAALGRLDVDAADLRLRAAPARLSSARSTFRIHPGAARFHDVLRRALQHAEDAVAALTPSTYAAAGRATSFRTLVILAPHGAPADAPPRAVVRRTRPGALERVVVDGRLLLRIPSVSSDAGVCLETDEPAFVEDALDEIARLADLGDPPREPRAEAPRGTT